MQINVKLQILHEHKLRIKILLNEDKGKDKDIA